MIANDGNEFCTIAAKRGLDLIARARPGKTFLIWLNDKSAARVATGASDERDTSLI